MCFFSGVVKKLSQFVTDMSCRILTHFLPLRRTGTVTSLTTVSAVASSQLLLAAHLLLAHRNLV